MIHLSSFLRWQTFITKTFNVSLTAGSNKILRIELLTGFWNPDSLQFAAQSCTAPTVTNPANKIGDATGSVTFTVTATGTSLPCGTIVDSASFGWGYSEETDPADLVVLALRANGR